MEISENFKAFGTVKLDAKNRVTLGTLIKKLKELTDNQINDFKVFIGNNGDILLKPRTAIPIAELWVHQNPKILKEIRNGVDEANNGKIIKINNPDEFFDKL
ncbi:MAG: hypothetical protein GWP03_06050 [Proteobacteria bacterium]|nr:hypothetical protein [Pseudomonadota bacterium]